MSVRVRFAPSPTGFLHIGGLRTALYNFLFARKHGGVFILRIEDTDRTRLVEGAVEALIHTLDRLGIIYNEGPIVDNGTLSEKGSHGPYIQSKRLDLYREHVQRLVDAGHAYYCFCSKERLDELRSFQQASKQQTKYDRACVQLSSSEINHRLSQDESYVIRMKIPDGISQFHDEIRGTITVANSEIDDQVLLKADGFPTYHLAVVVDDHAMQVTHVIRGEEWLSSVPKHLLLYQWLGFDLPVFAHLPLILNPDKSKLSKRQGDVTVEDFLAKGYLEETLINFVSLLGFNPTADREIYTQEEWIESIDLSKINKSGAVFDERKLLWMNGHYIQAMTGSALANRVKMFIRREGDIDMTLLEKICEIEKTRMSLLTEIDQYSSPYLSLPTYELSILAWKKSDLQDAKVQLTTVRKFLPTISDAAWSSPQLIDEALKRYITQRELQNGNVLWPLRAALSGSERSAGPHELLWVLGQEESLRRIDHALHLLS